MQRKIRITIRLGWVEEIDTKKSSMVQRQEEIANDFSRFVPPQGKLDIDVRAEQS